MIVTFIALGSNLQDPPKQLQVALQKLHEHKACQLQQVSAFYRSTAIGPGDQPDYTNAVAKLSTTLSPLALLDTLLQIENEQGRTREQRWGARTLDLDLLLYNQKIIQNERLTIPHPRMLERNFVLFPLSDIAPTMLLPAAGRYKGAKLTKNTQLTELIKKTNKNGLEKLTGYPRIDTFTEES